MMTFSTDPVIAHDIGQQFQSHTITIDEDGEAVERAGLRIVTYEERETESISTPQKRKSDWDRYIDEETGFPYIVNTVSGESKWDTELFDFSLSADDLAVAAAGEPDCNWVEVTDNDENVYFYNRETEESSWILPPGGRLSRKSGKLSPKNSVPHEEVAPAVDITNEQTQQKIPSVLLKDIIERKSSFKNTEEHPRIIESALSFETADQSVFKMLQSVERKSSSIEIACVSNSISSSRSESRTDSERTSVEFETKNIPRKHERQNILTDDGATECDGILLRKTLTSHLNLFGDPGGNTDNNDDNDHHGISDDNSNRKGHDVSNLSNMNVIDSCVGHNISEDTAFLRDIERVISAHLHAKDLQSNAANEGTHNHSQNDVKHTSISDILSDENNLSEKSGNKTEYNANIDDYVIEKKYEKEEIGDDNEDFKMLQALNEGFEENKDYCSKRESNNSNSVIRPKGENHQIEDVHSLYEINFTDSRIDEIESKKDVDDVVEGKKILDFLSTKIDDSPLRELYCVAKNEYNNSESSFLNSLGIIKSIAIERKFPEIGLRSTIHDKIEESFIGNENELLITADKIGEIEVSNDVLTDLEINQSGNEDFFLKYAAPKGMDDAMMERIMEASFQPTLKRKEKMRKKRRDEDVDIFSHRLKMLSHISVDNTHNKNYVNNVKYSNYNANCSNNNGNNSNGSRSNFSKTDRRGSAGLSRSTFISSPTNDNKNNRNNNNKYDNHDDSNDSSHNNDENISNNNNNNNSSNNNLYSNNSKEISAPLNLTLPFSPNPNRTSIRNTSPYPTNSPDVTRYITSGSAPRKNSTLSLFSTSGRPLSSPHCPSLQGQRGSEYGLKPVPGSGPGSGRKTVPGSTVGFGCAEELLRSSTRTFSQYSGVTSDDYCSARDRQTRVLYADKDRKAMAVRLISTAIAAQNVECRDLIMRMNVILEEREPSWIEKEINRRHALEAAVMYRAYLRLPRSTTQYTAHTHMTAEMCCPLGLTFQDRLKMGTISGIKGPFLNCSKSDVCVDLWWRGTKAKAMRKSGWEAYKGIPGSSGPLYRKRSTGRVQTGVPFNVTMHRQKDSLTPISWSVLERNLTISALREITPSMRSMKLCTDENGGLVFYCSKSDTYSYAGRPTQSPSSSPCTESAQKKSAKKLSAKRNELSEKKPKSMESTSTGTTAMKGENLGDIEKEKDREKEKEEEEKEMRMLIGSLIEESDSDDDCQFNQNVWLSLKPLLTHKTKQFNRDRRKERKSELQYKNQFSEDFEHIKISETISIKEKNDKEINEENVFSVTVPGIGLRTPDFSMNYLEINNNNSSQFRNQRPRSAPQGSRSLGPDRANPKINSTVLKSNFDLKLPIPKCLKSSNPSSPSQFTNDCFSSLFSVTSSGQVCGMGGRNAVQGPLERELLNAFEESELSDSLESSPRSLKFESTFSPQESAEYLSLLESVGKSSRSTSVSLVQLALWLLQKGLNIESLSVLSLAEETLSLPSPKHHQTDHPLPLCSLLIAKLSSIYTGKYKSIKGILNIIEKNPTPNVLILAAEYFVKIKHEKDAEHLYIGSLILHPSCSASLWGYAHLLIGKGNHRTATRYLTRIPEGAPEYPSSRVVLAWLKELTIDHTEIDCSVAADTLLASLKLAVQVGVKNTRWLSMAWHALGHYYHIRRISGLALTCYDRALENDPHNGPALLLRCLLPQPSLPLEGGTRTHILGDGMGDLFHTHTTQSTAPSTPSFSTSSTSSFFRCSISLLGGETRWVGLITQAEFVLCELGDADQCEALMRQAAGLSPSFSPSSSFSSFPSSPSPSPSNRASPLIMSSTTPPPSSFPSSPFSSSSTPSSSSSSIWPTIALAHFYLYVRGDARTSIQLLKRTIELRNKADMRNLPKFSNTEKLQIINSKSFKHAKILLMKKNCTLNRNNDNNYNRGNKYSEFSNGDDIDDLDSSDENIPDLTQSHIHIPDNSPRSIEDYERNNEDVALHTLLSFSFLQIDDVISASTHCKRALDFDPFSSPAHRCSAYIALRIQQTKSTAQALEEKARLPPGIMLSGEVVSMILPLSLAFRHAHGSPYSLRCCAAFSLLRGRHVEALKIFRAADSGTAHALTLRALALTTYLYGQGTATEKTNQAIGYLSRCLKLTPLNSSVDIDASLLLAQIYVEVRNFSAARMVLQIALKGSPDCPLLLASLAAAVSGLRLMYDEPYGDPDEAYRSRILSLSSIEEILEWTDPESLFFAATNPQLLHEVKMKTGVKEREKEKRNLKNDYSESIENVPRNCATLKSNINVYAEQRRDNKNLNDIENKIDDEKSDLNEFKNCGKFVSPEVFYGFGIYLLNKGKRKLLVEARKLFTEAVRVSVSAMPLVSNGCGVSRNENSEENCNKNDGDKNKNESNKRNIEANTSNTESENGSALPYSAPHALSVHMLGFIAEIEGDLRTAENLYSHALQIDLKKEPIQYVQLRGIVRDTASNTSTYLTKILESNKVGKEGKVEKKKKIKKKKDSTNNSYQNLVEMFGAGKGDSREMIPRLELRNLLHNRVLRLLEIQDVGMKEYMEGMERCGTCISIEVNWKENLFYSFSDCDDWSWMLKTGMIKQKLKRNEVRLKKEVITNTKQIGKIKIDEKSNSGHRTCSDSARKLSKTSSNLSDPQGLVSLSPYNSLIVKSDKKSRSTISDNSDRKDVNGHHLSAQHLWK